MVLKPKMLSMAISESLMPSSKRRFQVRREKVLLGLNVGFPWGSFVDDRDISQLDKKDVVEAV